MKKLEFDIYRDKVKGCWAGKNIGGILGAPFEGKREINQIEFYQQDLTAGPPPNDDLDLQIVFLSAVERYGRQINASILGEYWLSYIIPNWVEYGTGKANLRAGFVPPLSGFLDNTYKDSNGCWIRSELWACLAPGHPEIAARYAYEDAIVDHAGEGMYGEIFTAVVESAAFVEDDEEKLIEIGLSYIPENSSLAKCIRTALHCYKQNISFSDARKRVHNTAPGTFGIQDIKISEIKKDGNEGLEMGRPGFDCPENIGFMILGLLYGEGDFGKSICLANACGEDTDCTAGTLGAILGIIGGASRLPEKWMAPVDDRISTMCIDKTTSEIWVPDTATELTDRVIREAIIFIGQEYCDVLNKTGPVFYCAEGRNLYCADAGEYLKNIKGGNKSEALTVRELCELSPYCVRFSFPCFRVILDYEGSVTIQSGIPKKIKVRVRNVNRMHQQQWVKITLYLPEGARTYGPSSAEMPLNNTYLYEAAAEFSIDADAFSGSRLEGVIDVSLVGRHSSGAIKFVLVRDGKVPE